MSRTISIPDVYDGIIDGLRNDELYFFHKKADVADSFTIVEESHEMDSFDKDKLRNSLSICGRLLDAIAVSKKEDANPDIVIPKRIVCSFILWSSITDIEETIKNLQRMDSYCKEEDKESLGDVIDLLSEFDKDIKRKIES